MSSSIIAAALVAILTVGAFFLGRWSMMPLKRENEYMREKIEELDIRLERQALQLYGLRNAIKGKGKGNRINIPPNGLKITDSVKE